MPFTPDEQLAGTIAEIARRLQAQEGSAPTWAARTAGSRSAGAWSRRPGVRSILMARRGITEDAAFATLRRASQHLNTTLRDVAAAVVETRRPARTAATAHRTRTLTRRSGPWRGRHTPPPACAPRARPGISDGMDLAAPARSPEESTDRDAAPRRVLVLTASVGEGHNRAAAAIAGGVARREPGAEVLVHDVSELPEWSGESERRRYRLSVELFPIGYQLWYDAVNRLDQVHRYYRSVVGPRVGDGIRGVIDEARPDVVVSTYPITTAGLAWLRRSGALGVPVVAYLVDFAPHRFWSYPGVDRYLVTSEMARAAQRELAPDAPTSVCAPAVDGAFAPPDAERVARARERFGLPADGVVVLVSAGSMGMGPVRRAVRAARRAGTHVVATTGRNRWLSRTLRREPGVTVVEWTDDMPELIAAADVVVNNAGGATAAETLASGRALVMFRPIRGHGRASARMLSAVGLGETCTGTGELTDLLAGWVAKPERLREVQRRAAEHLGAPPDPAAVILDACPALGAGLGGTG